LFIQTILLNIVPLRRMPEVNAILTIVGKFWSKLDPTEFYMLLHFMCVIIDSKKFLKFLGL